MSVGFGGNAVFNRASPSSHPRCIARIVADYIATVSYSPVRILDVGGTVGAFQQHAQLPAGTQVIVANPETGSGAQYRFVADIPPSEPPFDFAMMFGVMMYLEDSQLLELMRDVRVRLRGHATFLIAEPDPEGIMGRIEVAAKRVYAAIRSAWDPTKFHFHTKAQSEQLLKDAGFVTVRQRPDLTPNAMGVLPPPMPPYFVVAASI
jgi:hypothetical protein